jgi:hypothetical protein
MMHLNSNVEYCASSPLSRVFPYKKSHGFRSQQLLSEREKFLRSDPVSHSEAQATRLERGSRMRGIFDAFSTKTQEEAETTDTTKKQSVFEALAPEPQRKAPLSPPLRASLERLASHEAQPAPSLWAMGRGVFGAIAEAAVAATASPSTHPRREDILVKSPRGQPQLKVDGSPEKAWFTLERDARIESPKSEKRSPSPIREKSIQRDTSENLEKSTKGGWDYDELFDSIM